MESHPTTENTGIQTDDTFDGTERVTSGVGSVAMRRATPLRAIHYGDSGLDIDTGSGNRKEPSPVPIRKSSPGISSLPRTAGSRTPSPFRASPRASPKHGTNLKHHPVAKRSGPFGSSQGGATSAFSCARTSKSIYRKGSPKSFTTTSPTQPRQATSRDLEFLNTRDDDGIFDVEDGGSDLELCHFMERRKETSPILVDERGRVLVHSQEDSNHRWRSSSWDATRGPKNIHNKVKGNKEPKTATEETAPSSDFLADMHRRCKAQSASEDESQSLLMKNALGMLSDMTLDDVFMLERVLSNRKTQLIRERIFDTGSPIQASSEEASMKARAIESGLSKMIRHFDEMQIENSYLVHCSGKNYEPPHTPERCKSGNCLLDGINLSDEYAVGHSHDDDDTVPGKAAPNFKMFTSQRHGPSSSPEASDYSSCEEQEVESPNSAALQELAGRIYGMGNLSVSPGKISFISCVAKTRGKEASSSAAAVATNKKAPTKVSQQKFSPGPTNGMDCISSPHSAFMMPAAQTHGNRTQPSTNPSVVSSSTSSSTRRARGRS